MHGKRYAYKFDFQGLAAATQPVSAGGPAATADAYNKYTDAALFSYHHHVYGNAAAGTAAGVYHQHHAGNSATGAGGAAGKLGLGLSGHHHHHGMGAAGGNIIFLFILCFTMSCISSPSILKIILVLCHTKYQHQNIPNIIYLLGCSI